MLLMAAYDAVSSLANEFPENDQYSQQQQDTAIELYAVYLTVANPDDPETVSIGELHKSMEQQLPREKLDSSVATRLRTIARLQWAVGQPRRAKQTMQLACDKWSELSQQLSSENPAVEQRDLALGDLGAILIDVANRELDGGNAEAARATFEQARNVLLPLVERHADDEYYRRDLGHAEQALNRIDLRRSEN